MSTQANFSSHTSL